MNRLFLLVQGEGFEPPNPMGADLQSAVFDRFTIPAKLGIYQFSYLNSHPGENCKTSNYQPMINEDY